MTRMVPSCLAMLLVTVFTLSTSLAWSAGDAPDKPKPQAVLEKLAAGNARFLSGKPLHPHQDQTRLHQAATGNQGDHAYATVLTCSDSRVPLETIFDAGIMDLFVIRVAGNVVKTDEAGSIEYGLAHVHTPVLVVLGHSQCGAVSAVLSAVQGHGHPLERNIPPLVAPIVPAVKKTIHQHPDLKGVALQNQAIEENVWQGVENLFMMSPATRELVKSGKVSVVGAVYDLATGKVNWLPQDKVAAILAKVEKNPKRAMNAMSD